MGHKVKQALMSSRIDFFYYAFRNVLLVSVPLLVVSSIVLSHLSFYSSATSSGSGTDSLTISISSACTLSSVVNSEHSTNTNVGTYTSDIGKTTITTLCNDGNGYSVYAVGYSNNEEGNNRLINTDPSYSNHSIDTGLATSGLTSQWAMKLNNISDDPSPSPPTIESDYNNIYGIVPPYWTKVASRASGTTDMAQGSSFTTTYAVYASSSQYAGTYNGQVKYLLTHPSLDVKHFFMQDVADWKDRMLPNEGDSIKAVDKRDGKSYWVTRLADGNIWMTQNLDLDLDPTRPLTSNDTDLTDHSLAGAYADNYNYDANTGVITWTPERRTIDFQNGTVAGWTNDKNNPYSANKTDSTETGHASLGNYYNWTAAIASNDSSTLTTNTHSNVANNPQNSICPKGWRLPTISNQSNAMSGSTNEFARLNFIYNNNKTSGTDVEAKLMESPLWFMWPGYINSTLNDYGARGRYWSSTVDDDIESYMLQFFKNAVYPAYDYTRVSGSSVRCIAR